MPTSRKKQGEGQRSSQKPGKPQQSQSREQPQDLKSREYRDKDGNIHHHTHKWMEDHAGGRKSTADDSEE